ncbi:MAG: glucodextranase DOMON-like domain-containing protein, partial [Actinomycetota bacterium]
AVQQGHEIQIDATDDADSTTGAVYNFQAADVAARDAALNPPGEWNAYELVVTGDRIQVLLNGVEVNDYTDTDPERMNAPSHIGIQNHGGGDEVYYRNIQVAEIPTPEGPAPTLDVTTPEADATVVGDTVTVTGTTDGVEVEARAGTALARTTPADGAFSVDVPVESGIVELAVTAVATDGSTTVDRRTITVSPDHGTLLGALTDPAGDDDGPGTYVYPTNEVFEDGVFDLTGLEVYADGDDRTFVIGIDGPVTNPPAWNGDQIAMQRVNVYLGDGSAGAQPALPGTNMDTESAWQAVVVIDGRYDAAGVYAPDGTMIAAGELFSDPANGEFGVVLPATAFGAIDLASATYGTAMFVNAEGGEGIGNVRPVYDLEYWQNPGPGMGYITEWRMGGGAGVFDNSPAHDTDVRDSNALDVIVGEGQAQSTVLDWTIGSPTQLPMVPLPVVPDPLTIEVSVDPAAPDGAEGWYVSPVTVTAVASDAEAVVEFDIDGGGFVADDDGVLVVDADGVHTVTARAVRGEEVSPVASV